MSKVIRMSLCLMMSMVMFLMTLPSFATVSANDMPVQPRYSYTAYTTTSLNISAAGKARCITDAEGYNGITTKIHIDMQLQQYLALQWTTIGAWTGTFNDYYGALSKTKTLTSSGNYRLKVVFTVYSGSASETITVYSQEKYFTKP